MHPRDLWREKVKQNINDYFKQKSLSLIITNPFVRLPPTANGLISWLMTSKLGTCTCILESSSLSCYARAVCFEETTVGGLLLFI